jgi:hypothetical protein
MAVAPAVSPPSWKEPVSLLDAVRRVGVAREVLARGGGVRLRYTEAELHAQASTGTVPNGRFLARLIYGDGKPTDVMGTVRPGGKLPLWVTTFEQLEPVDSDPEAITRVLGIPFDAAQTYTLLIIQDLGADEAQRPKLICPTLSAITELAATDLVTPVYTELDLRDALAPGYQNAYRGLMAGFYRRGFKEYVPDDVEHFIADEPLLHDAQARKRFLTRLRVHVQYGASDLFRGDGVTELLGEQSRKAGVLELFLLDPAPKPIGAYQESGKLVRVPCLPLIKPLPLQFLDPVDAR